MCSHSYVVDYGKSEFEHLSNTLNRVGLCRVDMCALQVLLLLLLKFIEWAVVCEYSSDGLLIG